MTDVNPILSEIHSATELARRQFLHPKRIRISRNLFDHLIAAQDERDRAYPPALMTIRGLLTQGHSLFATPLIVDDDMTSNEWAVDWDE